MNIKLFSSSSGYLSAVFARLIGQEGRVIGIDYLKPLAELSEANVRKDDPTLLNSNRTVFFISYFDVYIHSYYRLYYASSSGVRWCMNQ